MTRNEPGSAGGSRTGPLRAGHPTTMERDVTTEQRPAGQDPSDAERIVAELDLETRVALLSGADKWHLEGVPSAGLAPIMVADGPHGLRKAAGDELSLGDAVPATCFPTAVTLAPAGTRSC
jgi:hypothetical protein